MFSLVNILGLALGLTVCILIGLYVQNDVSFDRFHQNANNLYRLYTIDSAPGVSSSNVGITMPALPPTLEENLPEVVDACRINDFGDMTLNNEDIEAEAEAVILAEPSFLEMFDFRLISGDPETCMIEPESVLLSPEIASILYGDEDPIGKPIQLRMFDNAKVTGIIEPSPENSHIHFDVVCSMIRTEEFARFFDSWRGLQTTAYLQLAEGTDPQLVVEKAITYKDENGSPDVWTPQLQPFLDVHLHSGHIIYDSNYAEGDYDRVRTLSVIAIIVLLIASINFMNLSTARSSKRAREVGLRKVIGAHRGQMIFQFLGESIMLTLIATIISIVLAKLTLPYMNQLSGKSLEFDMFGSFTLLPVIFGIAIFIGILSGLYPATFLSKFKPAVVLKGSFKGSKSGIYLRRILVISQFAITIALLVGTLVVVDQINFILDRDPGYNRDQVLLVEHRSRNAENKREVLLDKLDQIPSVVSYGTSRTLPVAGHGRIGIDPEGYEGESLWISSVNTVDENFFKTYEMTITEGRTFSKEFPSDTSEAILINQAMATEMGWDEPIGKKIVVDGGPENQTEYSVIGVVKDYNFAPVREMIEPLVFLYSDTPLYLISIRLQAGTVQQSLEAIEAAYKEIIPDAPFVYSFIDDDFNEIYEGDKNFATVVSTFSALAIIIACLGLFGLASYSTEQRRKEIAVRKVLGAEEKNIISMLTIGFVRWVILANLIAWPVGYYAMQKWLEEFAYRIDLTVWPFIFAGAIAIAIAVVTVAYQSFRASRSNPVTSLRIEV